MLNFKFKIKAFTLIELLVVILIVALLIAVAAPSFLGQQNKAHDSKAKQQLALVYKQLKASYVSQDGFFPVLGSVSDSNSLLGELKNNEPSINFVAGPDTADYNTVDIIRNDSQTVTACTISQSNVAFCFRMDQTNNLTELASMSNVAAAANKTSLAYSTGKGTTKVLAERAAVCVLNVSSGTANINDCQGGAYSSSRFASVLAGTNLPSVQTNPALTSSNVLEGQTITANTGVWQNASSISQQWQKCDNNNNCQDISSETGLSYVIKASDNGFKVRLKVVAQNSNGLQSAYSDLSSTLKDKATRYSETIMADNPVYYLTLDSPAGSTSETNKGSSGGVFQKCSAPSALAPTFGAAGLWSNKTAASFTGNGEVLEGPMSSDVVNDGNFAIEAWFKTSYYTANWWKGIVTKQDSYGLFNYSSNLEAYRWPSTRIGTGVVITDGVWHHAVLNITGGNAYIYLDGVNKTAAPWTPNSWVAKPTIGSGGDCTTVLYGGSLMNQSFVGQIAQVASYNTALTPAQISAHYNAR